MSVYDKLDALEKVLQDALQQIGEIRASAKDDWLKDWVRDCPEWTNWIASNSNGELWAYENKPEANLQVGYFNETRGRSEYQGINEALDWTKSLKRIK